MSSEDLRRPALFLPRTPCKPPTAVNQSTWTLMAVRTTGRTTAGGCGRTLLIDDRTAFEHTEFDADSTAYDLSHRHSALRIMCQWFVVYSLKDLEASWRFGGIGRYRFVNIGRHVVLSLKIARESGIVGERSSRLTPLWTESPSGLWLEGRASQA